MAGERNDVAGGAPRLSREEVREVLDELAHTFAQEEAAAELERARSVRTMRDWFDAAFRDDRGDGRG